MLKRERQASRVRSNAIRSGRGQLGDARSQQALAMSIFVALSCPGVSGKRPVEPQPTLTFDDSQLIFVRNLRVLPAPVFHSVRAERIGRSS